MMVLRFSPSSPFVRKVRIAIALLGFQDEVTLERADTSDPNDSLTQANPLGKIPVLITGDCGAIYDSRVILDYLDERGGGGRIVPRAGKERLEALRLQALADGILDASVLTVYEGRYRRPDRHEPRWLDRQAGKVSRALAVLEAAPPAQGFNHGFNQGSDQGSDQGANPALPHVGQIAVACALGYRDLRFGGDSWRQEHPRLVAWLDDFAANVPAYAATAPAG